MLRTALCLSGQMREYRACYPDLKKNILDPLRPDIFIHTWGNSGFCGKASSRTRSFIRSRLLDEKVTERSLNTLYKPKAVVIEDYHDSYSDELSGVKLPDILKKKEPVNSRHALPMFYKMKKCNDLKSSWEKDNGFTYDLVIRLRPDLMIEEPITPKLFTQLNTLWYSDYFIDKPFQLSDKFALSCSEIMEYYSSVWDKLPLYWQNPLGNKNWKGHQVGERLMKYHMEQSSFTAKPFTLRCRIKRTNLKDKIQRKLQILGKKFHWLTLTRI